MHRNCVINWGGSGGTKELCKLHTKSSNIIYTLHVDWWSFIPSFNETWYERCSIAGHSDAILFAVLQSVLVLPSYLRLGLLLEFSEWEFACLFPSLTCMKHSPTQKHCPFVNHPTNILLSLSHQLSVLKLLFQCHIVSVIFLFCIMTNKCTIFSCSWFRAS